MFSFIQYYNINCLVFTNKIDKDVNFIKEEVTNKYEFD